MNFYLQGATSGAAAAFFLQHEEVVPEHPLEASAVLHAFFAFFFFLILSLLTTVVSVGFTEIEAYASETSIEPIIKPTTRTIFFMFI